jgi:hypothetical protein
MAGANDPLADAMRATRELVERMREAGRVPEPFPSAEKIAEREIERQAIAHERALRRVKKEARGEPGRPRATVTQDELLEILARGLEQARSTSRPRQPTYAAIASEFGLKRTWATQIVKWAEAHQKQAREAIALSKTPRRFSTIVSD